jgi:hypothetical protein
MTRVLDQSAKRSPSPRAVRLTSEQERMLQAILKMRKYPATFSALVRDLVEAEYERTQTQPKQGKKT